MDTGQPQQRNTRPVAAPLALHSEVVRPEWIDYNGHMNVAYYVLAFDHATDALLDYLDLGVAYRRRTNKSVFVLETHVTYDREVHAGDPLRFTTQILGYDAKRLHVFHHMYHATAGFLAATTELIALHVDLAERRSAPMPDAALAKIEALVRAHAALPKPPQAGRVIGIKPKPSP
jgi:acyl-CoA thioester hydrolase